MPGDEDGAITGLAELQAPALFETAKAAELFLIAIIEVELGAENPLTNGLKVVVDRSDVGRLVPDPRRPARVDLRPDAFDRMQDEEIAYRAALLHQQPDARVIILHHACIRGYQADWNQMLAG